MGSVIIRKYNDWARQNYKDLRGKSTKQKKRLYDDYLAAKQKRIQDRRDRENQKKDPVWIKQNLADKKTGMVYVRSKDKNQYGEYQLWAVSPEKYARKYDDRYSKSDYKILGGYADYQKLKDRNVKEYRDNRAKQKEAEAREKQLDKVQAQLKASGFEGTREQAEKTKIVSSATIKALKDQEKAKTYVKEEVIPTLASKGEEAAVQKIKDFTPTTKAPSETVKNWDSLSPAIQSKLTTQWKQKEQGKVVGALMAEADKPKTYFEAQKDIIDSWEGKQAKTDFQKLQEQSLGQEKTPEPSLGPRVDTTTKVMEPKSIEEKIDLFSAPKVGQLTESLLTTKSPVQDTIVETATISTPNIKDKAFETLSSLKTKAGDIFGYTPTGYVYNKGKEALSMITEPIVSVKDKIYGKVSEKTKPIVDTILPPVNKFASAVPGSDIATKSLNLFKKNYLGGMSTVTGQTILDETPSVTTTQKRETIFDTPTKQPQTLGDLGSPFPNLKSYITPPKVKPETVSYLSEDTMRTIDPEYDKKKIFKEAGNIREKLLGKVESATPEQFRDRDPSLLITEKEEYNVASRLVPEKLIEVRKEAYEMRNKIGNELETKFSAFESENKKLKNIKTNLLNQENKLVDKYGLEIKPILNEETGQYEDKYVSKQSQTLAKNYDDLLNKYESNPTEKNYYELKAAKLNYDNFNSNFLSDMGELRTKQLAFLEDASILDKKANEVELLQFKYNEYDDNAKKVDYEAEKALRELQEVDKFGIYDRYLDTMSKGGFVEKEGPAGRLEALGDWTKAEGLGLFSAAAKGGRGLIRGGVTEPGDYVIEEYQAGNLKNPLDWLGSAGVGLTKGVINPGEKLKVAEKFGLETEYKENLAKKGWFGRVTEDVDWEAGLALGTVATAGAASAASAAGGAKGAATFAKGTKYVGSIGKFLGLGKVVPKYFTETSMYAGIKRSGPEGEKAIKIYEDDRALFVDAFRAGNRAEEKYVKNKQAQMEQNLGPVIGGAAKLGSQIYEEVPGTKIISARVGDQEGFFKGKGERKKSFKTGVRDYYQKQGYSFNDAELMSEVAWKQRESGAAGEATAVGLANIGSEGAGQRFLQGVKTPALKEGVKLTGTQVTNLAAKSAYVTGKAGVLEGIAVGAARQSGQYERSDYGELATYGAAGGITAGAIGAALGGLQGAGKTKWADRLTGAVYVTDPWEPFGDFFQKKLARAGVKTLKTPVLTSTWTLPMGVGNAPITLSSPSETLGQSQVSTKAETISFTPSATEAPTFIDTITMPKTTISKGSVSIPGMSATMTQTRPAPFSFTTSPTTDVKIQTLSSLPESLIQSSKKTSGNIWGLTDVPTSIGTQSQVPSMITTNPYIRTLTETNIGIKPDVTPFPEPTPRDTTTTSSTNINVPPEIIVPPEVIVEVPTEITSYVNVPAQPTTITGGGGLPYLKGGWPPDMFGYGFGAGFSGWNVNNKIRDIAGEWLEGQRAKGIGGGPSMPRMPSMPSMSQPRGISGAGISTGRSAGNARLMKMMKPTKLKTTMVATSKKKRTDTKKILKGKPKKLIIKKNTAKTPGFFKR